MWVIWNGVTAGWQLEWFDKKTEESSGEALLKDFREEDMRQVLLVDERSLGRGLYPIDEARAARLKELIDIEIDLGKYDYFLGVVDTGLTEPDRSIKASDFPKHEIWYPAPRFLPEVFGETTKVTPKHSVTEF